MYIHDVYVDNSDGILYQFICVCFNGYDQVIREIPIPEIPFPIPDFLKTQKKFKNHVIFPEFPLEKNHLEFWCFYDKYINSNINTIKVEMHKLSKMLLFNTTCYLQFKMDNKRYFKMFHGSYCFFAFFYHRDSFIITVI